MLDATASTRRLLAVERDRDRAALLEPEVARESLPQVVGPRRAVP